MNLASRKFEIDLLLMWINLMIFIMRIKSRLAMRMRRNGEGDLLYFVEFTFSHYHHQQHNPSIL